jgi:pimeloyl-ACP methyl ester carboxylesterase
MSTTFVLVPGAWLGGWVWKSVSTMLEKEGYEAYPITLTGMGERVHLASEEIGMETAIQDVLNVISYNDLEDFILVGHSFAGKVAAAVADRLPGRVKTLLYLDAYRPQKNVRTPQGSLFPDEYGPLMPGQWTIPLTGKIVDAIGRDVQGREREWLLSKGTPWPLKLATDAIILSKSFDSVKTAYIFCTAGGDSVEEILAGKWGKLDGPHKTLDSGHWPMISKPAELVDAILSLASVT